MEKKINIAELLKNCPKGMELDCTMNPKTIVLNWLGQFVPVIASPTREMSTFLARQMVV